MKLGAWLKNWEFNKRDRLRFREAFQKGGQGSFCSETFYNIYENLIQTPNTFSEMPSLGFYHNLAKCDVVGQNVKFCLLWLLGWHGNKKG